MVQCYAGFALEAILLSPSPPPRTPRFALPGALARAVAAWRAGETFTFPAALEASKDGYGGGGGGGELGFGGIGAASGGDAFLSSLTEARVSPNAAVLPLAASRCPEKRAKKN